MKKVIDFIKENGFTSLVLIAVAVGLLISSKPVWSLFVLGIFIGRNWEIIRNLIKEGIVSIEGRIK